MNRYTISALAFSVVSSMGIASLARAEFVSLAATRDATLYESFDGSLANGAGRYFFAGKNNQVRARRGLIHFDIAGMLPTGASITGVSLRLNLSQSSFGPERAVSTHRALANWTTGSSDPEDPEGSGTTATANDATWLQSSADGLGGGIAWQNAGGDYAATASATVLTGAVGIYTWSSADLLADVLSFAANPSKNYGWFIIGDESTFGTARRFDSSESAALGGIAPVLEIQYTTVPAPGAFALIGVSGLFAMRRRR